MVTNSYLFEVYHHNGATLGAGTVNIVAGVVTASSDITPAIEAEIATLTRYWPPILRTPIRLRHELQILFFEKEAEPA